MAIATTFGTASTGTAISALSGAAATNAALAWLGGGALAAKGGGMVAGKALLALAGPVGWAIGGLAIAGSIFYASSKNKKIAEEAEAKVYEIKKQINYIIKTRAEIISTKALTEEHSASLVTDLNRVSEMVSKFKPKTESVGWFKGLVGRLFKKQRTTAVEGSRQMSYIDFDSDLKKELGSLVNNTLSLAALVDKKMV